MRDAGVFMFSIAVVALVCGAGCNTVLGNEEGTLRVDDAGAAPLEAGDAGTQPVVCDTTQGNKVCFGLCVKIDQPNTGCGGPSCDACDLKNVSATVCKGAGDTLGCGYDACKPAFEDCDGQSANGCETSLGAKETCGSCTTKCEGPTPFCALSGQVYGCVSSCPDGTQDCGGSCVDTSSSVENCGACGVRCTRRWATASCVNGKCEYSCNPGTHRCGNSCVSEIDPDACGPTCVSCPAGGANTVRLCKQGACGIACRQGFLDCDGNPGNGCEYQGNACPPDGSTCSCYTGGKCCNGTCVPLSVLCLPSGGG